MKRSWALRKGYLKRLQASGKRHIHITTAKQMNAEIATIQPRSGKRYHNQLQEAVIITHERYLPRRGMARRFSQSWTILPK